MATKKRATRARAPARKAAPRANPAKKTKNTPAANKAKATKKPAAKKAARPASRPKATKKPAKKAARPASRPKATKRPAAKKAARPASRPKATKKPAKKPTPTVTGPKRLDLRRRVLSEALARSLRTVKERVEAAKFHGPEMPEAPVPQPQVEEVPERYGESFIVLLPRDPWWLHSFWEVSPARLGEAADYFGDRWEQTRSVLRVYDVAALDLDKTDPHSWFDIELSGNASSWYIHVGNPNRTWVVDIGRVSPDNDFFVLARSNVAATPRDGMSDVLDEEWMEIDFEKMYALSGGLDPGQSSAELVGEMHRRLGAEGASGGVSSFGASPLGKAEKIAGFWFTLDCELVVYGATEPDATVTLQGQPVKLRPDGTFTVRMMLPDGVQEIETVATSADGSEERIITPVVSRTTTSRERALEHA
jgi:hypothetical protein